MNKKYDPVIDFASFQKWRDDFSRGIQDVVDADSREQMGKNVGEVLTKSLDAIFKQATTVRPESSYSPASGAANENSATATSNTSVSWAPCANCSETDTGYSIQVELAGVSMDDVNVEIIGNQLMVSGVAKDPTAEAHAEPVSRSSSFNQSERRFGNFQRTFDLPADSDVDAVHAAMEHGLLTLQIARQNHNRRRVKVEVKG